jgi:moderate conductance mechanosensitive channel
MDWRFVTSWFQTHGFTIATIVAGAWLVRHFGLLPLERFIRRLVLKERFKSEAEYRQRQDTLVDITRGVFGVIVWVVAMVMIISELNINIQPILAGAGIVGIALSFGAKDMIANVLAGFFVITENQYRVKDVVDLDGTRGQVEYISLRMTVLRDLDGIVHHIPNGTVKKASNLSKGYARVNLDVSVDYQTDIEKLVKVVNQIGKELAADKEWEDKIITAPEFLRINDFGETGMVIKIVGDVEPLEQWPVTGELRRRVIEGFKKAHIKIAYTQPDTKVAKAPSD